MSKRSGSLFRLLTSTFGLLFFFVFLSIAISTGIIIKIQRSVGLLVGSNFPTITLVNEIKIQNSYLSNLLPTLSFVETEQALTESVNRLLSANNRLFESIRSLPEEYAQEFNLAENIPSQEIESLIESQFELVRSRIVVGNQLDSGEKKLLKMIGKYSNDIEIELLDLSSTADEDGESIDLRRYFLVQDLYSLNEQFKGLSLLVSKTSQSLNKNVILSSRQEYSDTLRSASATVASLANGEYKTKFATSIGVLYQLHNSDSSFFGVALALINIDERLAFNNELIYENLREINKQLDTMFSFASHLNEKSVSDLGREASLALYFFILLTLIVVGTLAYIFLRVIPLKIVGPLKSLTEAIVNVGAGQLDYRRFDTSNIELRKIDDALAVFIRNAERLVQREEELLIKNDELDRSNENLKAFTRVSSHDLKSPLRGIRVLCSLVDESIESGELNQAKFDLERINQRTGRLERLLDSLLDYMKVDNYIEPNKTIVVCDIAEAQHEILHQSEKFPLVIESNVEKVTVPEAFFTLVLRNLLDNAIKHHDKDSGQIILRVTEEKNSDVWFSVEDNGPGISQEFQDRVFRPFETLKTKDEVEGSGMGLAIISKLVTNKNGRIWLESPICEGRGSRFVVTIPRDGSLSDVDVAST